MHYKDLTLHQKISLKGEFFINPILYQYKAIMVLWDFKTAINVFLTNDLNLLYSRLYENRG